MSHTVSHIERAAFAIFRTFIANAVGTCRPKRDADGNVIKDRFGKPVPETPDEAAARRWRDAPQLTRDRFRHEAAAALEAA